MIVLSILLAFGIEAGWQRHLERELETSAIVGIEHDFNDIANLLREHISSFQSRLDAIELLVSALGPNGSPESVDLAQTLATVGIVNEVILHSGTLETLISGAGISTLQDSDLQRVLSGWGQRLGELGEVNAFVTTEVRTFTGYTSQIVSKLPARIANASRDSPKRAQRTKAATVCYTVSHPCDSAARPRIQGP